MRGFRRRSTPAELGGAESESESNAATTAANQSQTRKLTSGSATPPPPVPVPPSAYLDRTHTGIVRPPSRVSASPAPAARLRTALSRTAASLEGYTSDGGHDRARYFGFRRKSANDDRRNGHGQHEQSERAPPPDVTLDLKAALELELEGGRSRSTTPRPRPRGARDRPGLGLRIPQSPLSRELATGIDPEERSIGTPVSVSASRYTPPAASPDSALDSSAIVVPIPRTPWRPPILLGNEHQNMSPATANANAFYFDALAHVHPPAHTHAHPYAHAHLTSPPPPPIPEAEHSNEDIEEMPHSLHRRPSTVSGALENGLRFSREETPTLTNRDRDHVYDQKVSLFAPRFEAVNETSFSRYKPRPRKRTAREHEIKNEGDKENTLMSGSTGEKTTSSPPASPKQIIAGRDAQSHFVLKNGKKHHRYDAKEVPFPRNYDRLVLDHEVWEALFYEQLVGGVSYLRFSTPPAKVLDLGCGPGAWILNAARVWKTTHFYGLDIVPIQPDLARIGSSDLASRVTWVHANLLNGFPFPDNFFDFIFIKRISQALPENKFDAFADECLRTLRPGGALEIVEEDLYFPGSCKAETEDDRKSTSRDREGFPSSQPTLNLSLNPSSNATSSASPASTRTQTIVPEDSPTESPAGAEAQSKRPPESFEQFHVKGTERLGEELDFLRPSASASDLGHGVGHGENSLYARHWTSGTTLSTKARSENDARRMVSQHLDMSSPPPTARPPRLTERAAMRKRSSSATRARPRVPVELVDPSRNTMLLRRSQSRGASYSSSTDYIPGGHGHAFGEGAVARMVGGHGSAVELLGGSGAGAASSRSFGGSKFSISSISGRSPGPPYSSVKDAGSNTSLVRSDKSVKSFSTSLREHEGSEHHDGSGEAAESQRTKSLELYHPSVGQPLNPRDHSLLERIYTEMHADRFINLRPLSLLAMCIEMIFTRVTSHAPISFAFPPKPQKRSIGETCNEEYDLSLLQHEHGEIDHAIVQYARNTVLSAHKDGSVSGSEERLGTAQTRRSLSRADELASQYVIIDNARLPAVPTRMRRPKPRLSTKSVSSGSGAPGSVSGETLMSPARGLRSTHSLPGAEAGEKSAHPLSEAPLMSASGADSLAASSSSVSASTSARIPTPPPQPLTPPSPGSPTKPLEIDLKSLHMHLSTRVVDTLACAEAMWEWVLAEQERLAEALRCGQLRGSTGVGASVAGHKEEDPQMAAIREMSRSDFDSCLSRFEMDMQDKIALDHALEQYLHVKPHLASNLSAERKSFDTACAAWDALHASETGRSDGSAASVSAPEPKYLSRTIRIFNGFKPL